MSRSALTNLGKLLDAAGPVYAVDEDDCLVYMNAACAAWLDCQPGELLGQKCKYHALARGDAGGLAAALCPPPGIGDAASAAERRALLQPVGRSATWADFIPLCDLDGEAAGMLVVVQAPAAPAALAPDSLTKRTSSSALREADAAALHAYLAEFRREQEQRFRVARFVGESPAMRRTRRQLQISVQTGAAVLLVGPPGSEQAHAARAIHYAAAALNTARFVPLSGGALSGEMLVSTIRAVLDSVAADEPPTTLFLQDVDALSPETQRALRSVLDGAEGRLRLIASAERTFFAAGAAVFDEGLAGLLSTIVVELPPLSERLDDLPAVVQALVEEFNADSTRQLAGLTADALDWLFAYDWPGDMAELRDIVRQACEAAAGPRVTAADFPPRLRHAREAQAAPLAEEPPIALEDVLQRLERQLIERALTRAKGNKSKAAELLGLTRPRLYRRLVQLGLAEGDEP